MAALLGFGGVMALLVFGKVSEKFPRRSKPSALCRPRRLPPHSLSLRPFDLIVYNRFRPPPPETCDTCKVTAVKSRDENHLEQLNHNPSSTARVYWRVEGSLADLTTVRPIAFFTWNAQTFLERWVRRGLVLLMALLRPFLYAVHRKFATRVVHTVLRGISRDRLDLLGEEYFKYKLLPYLKVDGMEQLKARLDAGADVVLVSQGLEHVMRPLAQHLGVKWLIANRLEFRDGIATGRLLEPGNTSTRLVRRNQRRRTRRQPRSGKTGPRPRSSQRECSGVRDRSCGPPESSPQSADRLFRWSSPHRPALGSPRSRRKAHHADRRDRLYRQSLAGQYLDGVA